MPIEPFRIEIPLGIMFQTVNCYLIPGEQLTLIDCGLYSEENWDLFQKKINDLGYQIKDIEQVIITHEHSDHIGLLPEIMAHSNAIVRAPKVIEGWFSQPTEMKKRQGDFNKKIFSTVGFPQKIYNQVLQFVEMTKLGRQIQEMDRIHFYEAGDFLRIGNTEWEILNTPGHSLTQYVFLQKQEKRIFGSDMLLPIAPMPILMENPNKKDEPVQPLIDLLHSFERLKKYNIQTVYPGHGETFQDANQMIDKQLARIQMRKEECYEAIKNGLISPYQINRKMYPYQFIPPDFSGMYMILGYLDLLQNEGRILKSHDKNGSMVFSIK